MPEATPNRRRTLALAVGGVLLVGVVLGRRSLSGHATGGEGGCEGSSYQTEAVGSAKQAIAANTSLCARNACTETLDLMETDASFKSHFSVVQGDHVGTHEYEKYFTSQATYANGAVTLAAVPSPPFACKANGNFDSAGNVSEGTCTYKSGAVYTRGLFTVNKKGDTLIPHGAIEVDVTIAANGNVTLGKGLWPAIWMMSNRLDDTFMHDGQVWGRTEGGLWPSAMELDILEYMQGSSAVMGTLHYGLYTGKSDPMTSWNYVNNADNQQVADWTHVPGANVLVYRSDPTTRHTFGFQWKKADTSVELTWYYDGNPYYNYSFRKSLGDGGRWEYAKTKRIIDSATTQWRTIPDLECIKSASWSCANAGACIQAAQVIGKCPDKFVPDADGVGDKLAYAMFQSFQNGFDAGYYLILNLAIGGDGVVKGGGAPASDITETMTIHGVKRHILSP